MIKVVAMPQSVWQRSNKMCVGKYENMIRCVTMTARVSRQCGSINVRINLRHHRWVLVFKVMHYFWCGYLRRYCRCDFFPEDGTNRNLNRVVVNSYNVGHATHVANVRLLHYSLVTCLDCSNARSLNDSIWLGTSLERDV